MIVNKKEISPNKFQPDFSLIELTKWEIVSCVINEDENSYTVELIWISAIPFSITPTQGRMMLLQMGLLGRVKEAVEKSTNESLLIFWEYALSWDRDNIHIAAMAAMLDMSEDQTDDFFIEAKKL